MILASSPGIQEGRLPLNINASGCSWAASSPLEGADLSGGGVPDLTSSVHPTNGSQSQLHTKWAPKNTYKGGEMGPV